LKLDTEATDEAEAPLGSHTCTEPLTLGRYL